MFSPEGYKSLRDGAGVVRRGDRGVLSVTGADRLTWLQGLLTNDVAAMPIGGVRDAAYLTPQGRMVTDMRVIHRADRTLLDVPASLAPSLQTRLDGLLFSEDAEVRDVSRDWLIVDIHGPGAPAVVDGEDVVADAAFGVPGYTAFVPPADIDGLVARLVSRGAIETTLATLDVVRVEAGRPAFLIDMDEHTIPLEAGIEDRAISFTKGCYVGQEVIVRVMHRGGGRVAKKLVGLTLSKGEVPKRGDIIVAADREIGRVTSAVWSPALQGGIALGYVHRDFVDAGSAVAVRTSHGPLGATVSPLPFVTTDVTASPRAIE
jgi:tRNA-modifying protein YgfZ